MHLLLGCDGYIANAIAGMVAEKTEGVLLPMLPFSWIGGLRPFAGTIDMAPVCHGRLYGRRWRGGLEERFRPPGTRQLPWRRQRNGVFCSAAYF